MSATIPTKVTRLISTVLLGDFNGGGVVDAADYTVWADNVAATKDSVLLHGNGNGSVVDGSDYDLWKNNFGLTTGAGSTAFSAVPEPPSVMLLVFASASVIRLQRIR